MSETVSNAFLLLLGQIGLFFVALFFGFPLALFSGELDWADVPLESYMLAAVVGTASIMMVANIMIGWGAVKYAQERVSNYSNRLFTVDLIVIFIFFSMNNVIIYALGAGFSAFDPAAVMAVLKKGVEPGKISFTLGVLTGLSATYLYACKVWNREFYRLTETADTHAYEKKMSAVIVTQTVLACASLLTPPAPIFQASIAFLWMATWVVVNGEWVREQFVK